MPALLSSFVATNDALASSVVGYNKSVVSSWGSRVYGAQSAAHGYMAGDIEPFSGKPTILEIF